MDSETRESIERFAKAMRERAESVRTNLGRSVNNACQLVENTAKLGMTNTETDSSKAYSRGRKTHYASIEFDYPAVDTGHLRQSVTHDVSQEGETVVGRVGSNIRYGLFLEGGTSKMSPRPWLKPSLAINREKIYKLIVNAIKGREVEIGDVEV